MLRIGEEISGCEKQSINVGQEERWVSMFAAGALAAAGLMRGSPIFLALSAGFALRGATGHCALYEAIGYSTKAKESPRQSAIAY